MLDVQWSCYRSKSAYENAGTSNPSITPNSCKDGAGAGGAEYDDDRPFDLWQVT